MASSFPNRSLALEAINPREDDQDESKDDEPGKSQSEFLADHREDKIGMGIRQIEHLLPPLSQSESVESPRSEGDKSLPLLKPLSELILLGMKETGQPGIALRNKAGDAQNAADSEAA